MSKKYVTYEDVRNDTSIEFIEDLFGDFINLNETYNLVYDDYYKVLNGRDEWNSIYWYFKLVNVENTNKLVFKSEEKKYEMLETIVTEHRFTDSCEETVIWSLYKNYKLKFPETK